jgi:hypothetical protein
LIAASVVLPPCEKPSSATRSPSIPRCDASQASAPSASSRRLPGLMVRDSGGMVQTSRCPRELKLSGKRTA